MNTPETETPELCGSEESSHRWIGDTCGRCGVAYGIFAERTLKDLNEKARTLERENAQLRKELEEARRKLTKPTPDELALCKWYKEAIADRDHFRTLAQTNWQVAEELAASVLHIQARYRMVCASTTDELTTLKTPYDDVLSRFQTLKQQQPK